LEEAVALPKIPCLCLVVMNCEIILHEEKIYMMAYFLKASVKVIMTTLALKKNALEKYTY
jgi:hypothetical protein